MCISVLGHTRLRIKSTLGTLGGSVFLAYFSMDEPFCSAENREQEN